jgi:hypothetical protein
MNKDITVTGPAFDYAGLPPAPASSLRRENTGRAQSQAEHEQPRRQPRPMTISTNETAPMASRGGAIRVLSAFPAGGRNNTRHFRHVLPTTDFRK